MSSIIVSQHTTLGYKKKEPIIRDINIDIKAGDFVFVTGKSGSGKSTFLKSLYGDISPQSGQLNVCGVDIRKNMAGKKLNFLRKHLGIIFQDYKLIKEWSIEKNIMLPLLINGYSKALCKERTNKFLNHVKLSHKAHKYPMELSGGEQQRAAVARAMAANPTLILADEPTGNLDEYSSEVIWNFFKGVREILNTTIVVVTHKLPSNIYSDYKQFFINDGVLHEIN